MPSASAKQHRFMEAVAHNPTFAKKVSISQSVGKDFSAADKGKRFGRGGSIDKQNTQRGSMDMQFKSLKKFRGMNSGGKVKRYFEGDEVENTAPDVAAEKPAEKEKPAESLDKMSFGKAFREKLNELGEGKTFMWRGKSYSTDLSKPSNPIPKSTPTAKATPSNETNAGARTGRTDPISKKMVGEDAMGNRRNQAQEDSYVASLSKKPEARMSPSLNYAPMRRGMKFGGSVEKSEMGMKKGGMHKMPNGKMMKDSAMKKGGMPMKDGKPAFMKKMMGGGMAGYAAGGVMTSKPMPVKIPTSPTDYRSNATSEARDDAKAAQARQNLMDSGIVKKAKGGGIESRGKTKGTVIRMASGGSVSARADGIAQRGKTKAKMC